MRAQPSERGKIKGGTQMDLPTLLAQQRQRFAEAKQRSQQRALPASSGSSPSSPGAALTARLEKHKERLKELAVDQAKPKVLFPASQTRPVDASSRYYEDNKSTGSASRRSSDVRDAKATSTVPSTPFASPAGTREVYGHGDPGVSWKLSASDEIESREEYRDPGRLRMSEFRGGADSPSDGKNSPDARGPAARFETSSRAQGHFDAKSAGYVVRTASLPHECVGAWPLNHRFVVHGHGMSCPQSLRGEIARQEAKATGLGSLPEDKTVVWTLNQEVINLTTELQRKSAALDKLQCVAFQTV
jgi:hypothetical protein